MPAHEVRDRTARAQLDDGAMAVALQDPPASQRQVWCWRLVEYAHALRAKMRQRFIEVVHFDRCARGPSIGKVSRITMIATGR